MIRKEFELQRVRKRLIRTTSRTEVTFPCRTTTWGTNRFPFLKLWKFRLHKLLWAGEVETDTVISIRDNTSWWSNTTTTQNYTDHTRYKWNDHIKHTTCNAHFIFQTLNINGCRALILCVQNWSAEKDLATVMPSSRHLVRFGEEPMAHSYINISRVRRQKPWIHAQSTSKIAMLAPKNGPVQKSTNEGDDDDFDYGALIDRADQRDQLPPNKFINHNTIMGERIMVSNRSIMHGKVIGNIMAGDSHKTCGTPSGNHNWRWLPQYKRSSHRRQMDTTDTTGQHHDSHHLYAKQLGTFFCSCESVIFQNKWTCLRIFRLPVHCPGLIAREISDKNADMDYHAVPPPEYQAGGDSKRDNLCRKYCESVSKTTPGASNSEQLEAAGGSSSGRQVATEVVFTIYWTGYEQNVVKVLPISKISISTFRCGPKLRPTAHELHLGLQRITKTSKGWRWNFFQGHNIWCSLYEDNWKKRAKTHTMCKSCRTGTHVWNEHGFVENWIWQPEKCKSFGTYCQGVSTMDIKRHMQKFGQTPKYFDERIMFISLFDDIGWTKKGNTETCLHNAKDVAAFATFLGRASEIGGGTSIPTNL